MCRYTFGFLHVKAVDDAGHDRNIRLKNVSISFFYSFLSFDVLDWFLDKKEIFGGYR